MADTGLQYRAIFPILKNLDSIVNEPIQLAEAKKLTKFEKTSSWIRHAIKYLTTYDSAKYLSTFGETEPKLKLNLHRRFERRKMRPSIKLLIDSSVWTEFLEKKLGAIESFVFDLLLCSHSYVIGYLLGGDRSIASIRRYKLEQYGEPADNKQEA